MTTDVEPIVMRSTPEQVAKRLTNYWETYKDQPGYNDYAAKTVIEDALYGLGVALDNEKYMFGKGFDEFKKDLLAYLSA